MLLACRAQVMPYKLWFLLTIPMTMFHNLGCKFFYVEKPHIHIWSIWDQCSCYSGCFKSRETRIAYSYITPKFKQTASRESGAVIQGKVYIWKFLYNIIKVWILKCSRNIFYIGLFNFNFVVGSFAEHLSFFSSCLWYFILNEEKMFIFFIVCSICIITTGIKADKIREFNKN